MKPWIQPTPILIERYQQPVAKVDGMHFLITAKYSICGRIHETKVSISYDKARNLYNPQTWLADMELDQLSRFIPKFPTNPKILARRRKAVHGIRGQYKKCYCSNCLQK